MSIVAGLLGASISVNSGGYAGGTGGNTLNTATGSGITPQIPAMFFAVILSVGLVLFIWAIVMLVIGGATTLGYARYNLNLVDDTDPKFKDLFSQYHRLGTGFGMQFFRGLFTFLWSLLLVIPGIIASYSYYLTPYILVEHPEMTAREAIRESKELMRGNKWRLFCLDISFIGWLLLWCVGLWIVLVVLLIPIIIGGSPSALTISIICIVLASVVGLITLQLFITPYIETAVAVFYREIKDGKYSNPQVETTGEEYFYQAGAQDVIDAQPDTDYREETEI